MGRAAGKSRECATTAWPRRRPGLRKRRARFQRRSAMVTFDHASFDSARPSQRMPPAQPLSLELTLPGLIPDAELWARALPRLRALHTLLARAHRSTVECEHIPAFFL